MEHLARSNQQSEALLRPVASAQHRLVRSGTLKVLLPY